MKNRPPKPASPTTMRIHSDTRHPTPDTQQFRTCFGRSILGAALTLALFALTQSVQAQTAYGPGGLFVQPTAVLPPARTLNLNVSTFTQRIEGRPSSQWIPASLAYSISDRIQAGPLFLHRSFNGGEFLSGGLFARYALAPDKPNSPAIALTGSFLTGDVRLASVGLVGSHAFKSGDRTVLSLHAGGLWGRRDDIPNPGDSLSAFIGADVPLGREFSLIAEYGTRFSFDYKERSSYGVVYRPKRGPQIGVSFVNTGRSSENGFFVGVGYPLGGDR